MSDIHFNTLQAADGLIGEVVLDRPKALNALTFDMINAMLSQLTEWQQAADIKAVLVRSTSEKAFCAGGDVVSLYQAGKQSGEKPLPFFMHEYQLNCLIHAYQKPYICLLDGITMGGGVGISLHGCYPLATEHFSFAMPETGIGFFPDVGGGYLLSRCQQQFGQYLGLTGKRINREDAVYAGLIKYTIARDRQAGFIEALQASHFSNTPFDVVEQLLQDFQQPVSSDCTLKSHQDLINQAFSQDSVEKIINTLQDQDKPWSAKTLSTLNSKSPLALKVTLAQLQRAEGLTMVETMQLEYRMVNRFMAGSEFYEGVRALLVDKDKSPNWQPAELQAVSESMVEAFFQPLEQEFCLEG